MPDWLPLAIGLMVTNFASWIVTANLVIRSVADGRLIPQMQQRELLKVKDEFIQDLRDQNLWLREALKIEEARSDLLAANQVKLLDALEVTRKVVESIAASAEGGSP